MASQAHGEPITGSSLTASPFSTKKKKKNTESEIEPNQPITSLAPSITSRRRWLAERSIPNTKANQTQNSTSQTQSTEVFIKKKKKKIPNTQTKIKPSKPFTHGRSRRHRRRRRRSPGRPHRRLEIKERRTQIGVRCSPLGAPSGPPSRYFALFSL